MRLLPNSMSQAGQESFVQNILNFKTKGSYVEIGAWDAKHLSNTYLLETQFGFHGIALEISRRFAFRYNLRRRNRCIRADATTVDYLSLFKKYNMPKIIDYLQLDIAPPSNTFMSLTRIPFEEYQFRVITFEHDLYSSPENLKYKNAAFDFLTKKGYDRLASNVQNDGYPFEDWYIKKDLLTDFRIEKLASDVDWHELFTS